MNALLHRFGIKVMRGAFIILMCFFQIYVIAFSINLNYKLRNYVDKPLVLAIRSLLVLAVINLVLMIMFIVCVNLCFNPEKIIPVKANIMFFLLLLAQTISSIYIYYRIKDTINDTYQEKYGFDDDYKQKLQGLVGGSGLICGLIGLYLVLELFFSDITEEEKVYLQLLANDQAIKNQENLRVQKKVTAKVAEMANRIPNYNILSEDQQKRITTAFTTFQQQIFGATPAQAQQYKNSLLSTLKEMGVGERDLFKLSGDLMTLVENVAEIQVQTPAVSPAVSEPLQDGKQKDELTPDSSRVSSRVSYLTTPQGSPQASPQASLPASPQAWLPADDRKHNDEQTPATPQASRKVLPPGSSPASRPGSGSSPASFGIVKKKSARGMRRR